MIGPLPLENVLDHLASAEPTPGGGTAAALAGATGAALAEMVLGLTLGKDKFKDREATLAPLLPQARNFRALFLSLADQDSAAYEGFVRAMRLPKATPAEQAARKAQLQGAALVATEVPLATMRAAAGLLAVLQSVAQLGNPNARSDAWVGAHFAWVAFEGGRLNVQANLDQLLPEHAARIRAEVAELAKRAEALHAGALAGAGP
ncbi:MAG TPA: cyclodeaminase/cyclohydrolase family protein [Candidatus Thermoplasmatota archaeon]|jgi:glutamate formiminotransferase/formiminotetrahydrofolate cyclodeaminase|nr:cyclodeaminase/cyclohydrolase family protein [Candidatus Thermoplasmatota archaeon]